jgi:hypothetical protein
LLRRDEFVTAPTEFTYYDVSGTERSITLKSGSLAFTYCQVPIIYRLAPENALTVVRVRGVMFHSKQLHLDAATSRLIFERGGEVRKIEVSLGNLRGA